MTMWGVLPLYFTALSMVSPDLMLSHRIAWSVPVGIGLLIVAGRWGDFVAAMRNRRTFLAILAAGALIGLNWLTYIWAVQQERVLEASLGYYINPLVNFMLGAILFAERFSKLQILAMVLACLGVLNQWLYVGVFPWVALTLCATFAVYSVIRKVTPIDSRIGFTGEVLVLLPLALVYMASLGRPVMELFPDGQFETFLLVMSGVITAAPLILFGVAARRLNLSTIGLIQFLGPTLQFLIGLYLGEAFTLAHFVTFSLIWSGVGLFCFALWRQDHRRRLAEAA